MPKARLRNAGLAYLPRPRSDLDSRQAMALVKVADDLALEQIEGGKEGSRSVPFVVMCHSAAATFLERQARLGAV